MAKKTKAGQYVKKVIACSCVNRFDVLYTPGVPGLLVIEHRHYAVDKGREFTCSRCGETHDARKDGKEQETMDWGEWARIPAKGFEEEAAQKKIEKARKQRGKEG